jgi:hypothetical protein
VGRGILRPVYCAGGSLSIPVYHISHREFIIIVYSQSSSIIRGDNGDESECMKYECEQDYMCTSKKECKTGKMGCRGLFNL